MALFGKKKPGKKTEEVGVELKVDPKKKGGQPETTIDEVIGIAESTKIGLLQDILAEMKGLREDLKDMDEEE